MEYSLWNPPPQRRKIIGDFFYLKIRTLEGECFHATAFSKGFYINKSTDEVFDPTADSELCYSIIDLIAIKSSSFKGKVDLGLFTSINVELKNIELSISLRPQVWLKQENNMEDHVPDNFRAG